MKTFRLDRSNGKFLGVCAGLAEATGLNANIIRIALVVLTIGGAFPWTVIGYFGAAWAANKMEKRPFDVRDYRPSCGSLYGTRTDLSDIDRRMAEIDSYVASPNSSLAREIDSLR